MLMSMAAEPGASALADPVLALVWFFAAVAHDLLAEVLEIEALSVRIRLFAHVYVSSVLLRISVDTPSATSAGRGDSVFVLKSSSHFCNGIVFPPPLETPFLTAFFLLPTNYVPCHRTC